MSAPKPVPIYQVDAFTARPFAGNPAAVCLLPEARDDAWLQVVAREMNLSETAFLLAEDDGWHLRWFTPTVEVELCGHATLASAHVLWETGLLAPDRQARFRTASGLLLAVRRDGRIELDLPATPPVPAEAPPGLFEALGIASARYVGSSVFDLIVELDDEAAVRAVAPDFGRLARVDARGVMVTGRATTAGWDFVSRFFGPAVGVDEDPVTGSAHCCLGPYWSRILGRTELSACQLSARGGVLGVRVAGDRVVLSGEAVTVLRGELTAAVGDGTGHEPRADGPAGAVNGSVA
jgi:PhzF family phenazine biosynthesis protein